MPITEAELTPQERLIYDTLNGAQQDVYLDLSDEVRAIVGRWAPPNACFEDQQAARVCVPDPRVRSQVGIRQPTDWDLIPPDSKHKGRIREWRIKDARKGDLLLTPGGPSGMIGAMLSALNPPQDYSHMGIVIEDDGTDGTVLRHCTASEDWLNRNLFTTGTVFGGTGLEAKIPLRGIRSDALRFIWPGTITQTVEVAYKSFRDVQYRAEVYELDADDHYVLEKDENGKLQKILRDKYAVLDPARPGDDRGTGGRYRIAALTFDAVKVPAIGPTPEHRAPPLIVQPCRTKRTASVRRALERIADASKELRGHYRFFAYTDGRVGDLEDGPVTLEDLTEPACINGQWVADPVAKTRGMVCSTFVWQAAQRANLSGAPLLLLDGRPQFPEPPDGLDDECAALTAKLGRRRGPIPPQSPTNPVDGLYFYTPTDRKGAADALQKKLVGKVMENLSDFLDTVTGPPLLGAFQGILAGFSISQLLALNPIALATLLGITKAALDSEVQKIRDTARHLSNQIGDTFRKDNAALDNDSDEWVNDPGEGHTVSPDDTVNGWASPHKESGDIIAGLYGSNIAAQVLAPDLTEGEWRPSTWEIAMADASLGVRVFFRDANGAPQTPLAGATVRVGCAELTTVAQANMNVPQPVPEVRTGQYFAWAVWTDPATTWQWRSPRRIVEVPGPDLDIEVFPPKQTRREVHISGKADLLNRHASDEIPVLGTDPWEQTVEFGSGGILMSLGLPSVNPAADPEFFAWLQESHGSDLKGLQERTWPVDFQMEDWGIVRVEFTCKLTPTGAIEMSIRGGTREGVDPNDMTEPDWGQTVTHQVPPRQSDADPRFDFDLKVERSGIGFPPVRATLHVRVDNNPQPG